MHGYHSAMLTSRSWDVTPLVMVYVPFITSTAPTSSESFQGPSPAKGYIFCRLCSRRAFKCSRHLFGSLQCFQSRLLPNMLRVQARDSRSWTHCGPMEDSANLRMNRTRSYCFTEPFHKPSITCVTRVLTRGSWK